MARPKGYSSVLRSRPVAVRPIEPATHPGLISNYKNNCCKAAVKESKDRVTSAISNSAFRWPDGKRITTNLAPADVRKEGPSFDLPIALGMLKLEENNRLPALDAFCITGELALSGQSRPVKGVLSIALEAKRRQRQTLIVPLENAAEAAVVEGVDVYGVCSLSQVVHFLRGDITLDPVRSLNSWSASSVSVKLPLAALKYCDRGDHQQDVAEEQIESSSGRVLVKAA